MVGGVDVRRAHAGVFKFLRYPREVADVFLVRRHIGGHQAAVLQRDPEVAPETRIARQRGHCEAAAECLLQPAAQQCVSLVHCAQRLPVGMYDKLICGVLHGTGEMDNMNNDKPAQTAAQR